MAQLECQNLKLGYDSRAIVENLSFKVNKGDYLCILGENGSGKSTLMKTILHLNKPLAGTIKTGDGLLPDEIGYLPQQTLAQKDFPASVKEIVLSGCQSRCGKRPFYNKKEKQLLILKGNGEVDNSHFYGFFIIMHRLLPHNIFKEMKSRIIQLTEKYPFVKMKYYGFRYDWQNKL